MYTASTAETDATTTTAAACARMTRLEPCRKVTTVTTLSDGGSVLFEASGKAECMSRGGLRLALTVDIVLFQIRFSGSATWIKIRYVGGSTPQSLLFATIFVFSCPFLALSSLTAATTGLSYALSIAIVG
jgi:hypothetical protein